MLQGGYRRKPDTYKFVLTNSKILGKCNTENLTQLLINCKETTQHILYEETIQEYPDDYYSMTTSKDNLGIKLRYIIL